MDSNTELIHEKRIKHKFKKKFFRLFYYYFAATSRPPVRKVNETFNHMPQTIILISQKHYTQMMALWIYTPLFFFCCAINLIDNSSSIFFFYFAMRKRRKRDKMKKGKHSRTATKKKIGKKIQTKRQQNTQHPKKNIFKQEEPFFLDNAAI